MLRTVLLAGLVLVAGPATAVVGDLNLDGVVDLKDFFIFADHFGQKGPPDTLRVEVIDTLTVTVLDTVEVVIRDTVHLQGPVPDGLPPTEQTGLIDGYWKRDPYHKTMMLSLAGDQGSARVRVMRVLSADSGIVYARWYIKPTGHLLQEEAYHYSTMQIGENLYALYGDSSSDQMLSTRYFYDADMQVIGSVKASAWEFHRSSREYVALIAEDFIPQPSVHPNPLPYCTTNNGYLWFEERRTGLADISCELSTSDLPLSWNTWWSKDGIDWETELQK